VGRVAAIVLLATLAAAVPLGAADFDCGSGCALGCLTCACCHLQGVIEDRIEIPLALSSSPLPASSPATLPLAAIQDVLHVPKLV
jgi:hypothetical protein